MSSATMINIITKKTTKKEHRKMYSQYPDTNPKGIEAFHTSTVEPIFCEVPEGSIVLDVGCNSGELMKLLRDSKKCEVFGVDISTKALKLARQKGLRVKNASAEKLPYEDKTFDVVILREVLVHIHEPLKAIKEIRRVLKDDGVLLGSAPHANLERIVWDDKRLHHRYYNEETIMKDLESAFDRTYLKVLTGAQFSIGFASSLLSDKPAELLFKSGGLGTKDWDAALLEDTKTLRAWMAPTQPPGDAYYRMIGFANKMRGIEGVEIGYENFSWNSNDECNEWQRKVLMNEDGMPVSSLALDQLDKCLRVSNPWVFQVTYYEDVLILLQSLKESYPSKKLITEMDDWLFNLPSYNVASNPYKPNSPSERIAYEQLKLSDAIICSTSFIKEKILEMIPGKKVYVVPNSIDFKLWDNAKSDGKMEKKGEGVVRIGFSGCGNHNGDLESIKPVLLALLDEHPNLEIIMAQKFNCFNDVTNPRFKVLERWVNIMDYPSMIKGWDLDIGIAPLLDNNFNRAKSNLRWLEYSALGIPTVASNVRPFRECIDSHVDGVLCSSKQEWYQHLTEMITRPNIRKIIGEKALYHVEKDFNMDKVSHDYAKILKEIRDER